MVKQYDKNAHYAWKALIHRYEVSNENQDTLNEVTNRWNNCSIKDTSQDTDIWFNDLFNLNLKFKKIKAGYEKYEDEHKEHFFDVLPENKIQSWYPATPIHQRWNLNIYERDTLVMEDRSIQKKNTAKILSRREGYRVYPQRK